MEAKTAQSLDFCAAFELARIKIVIIECIFCFLEADHVRRLTEEGLFFKSSTFILNPLSRVPLGR